MHAACRRFHCDVIKNVAFFSEFNALPSQLVAGLNLMFDICFLSFFLVFYLYAIIFY